MTDVIPAIRELDDCASSPERAFWLLTASFDVLLSCEMTIRNRLLSAGFRDGLDYLDIELAAQRRKRREDGSHFNNYELKAARGRMVRILLDLPPR